MGWAVTRSRQGANSWQSGCGFVIWGSRRLCPKLEKAAHIVIYTKHYPPGGVLRFFIKIKHLAEAGFGQ
jgi:hypothetical protein